MPRHFLIIIVFIIVLLIGFLVGYWLCLKSWENRKNVLPKPYRDWFIIKEMYLDVDGDNQNESLVAITNKFEDISSIAKVLILKDGKITEVPEHGSSIIWWEAGDFNRNGWVELVVQYDNYGSGNFLPWYLYEWNGRNFEIILKEEEQLLSKFEIRDLNGDDIMEIQHIFYRKTDSSFETHYSSETFLDSETFEWDDQDQKYVLSE